MPTIALYANKINQMPGLIQDVKKSVVDYQSELSALKKLSFKINQSICNLSDVISSIQASSQTQEQKIASLETFQQNSEQFIEETARIDSDVADVIKQRKDDFYDKYNYLKPDYEKGKLEKLWSDCKSGLKSAGEWCKEHWKLLVTIVIVVVTIALICTGVGGIFGAMAVGALFGAGIGGIVGGIMSVISENSFLEGFENGAFSGAIAGILSGGMGFIMSVGGSEALTLVQVLKIGFASGVGASLIGDIGDKYIKGDNISLTDICANALVSGIVSAAFSGAGYGISKGLSYLFKNTSWFFELKELFRIGRTENPNYGKVTTYTIPSTNGVSLNFANNAGKTVIRFEFDAVKLFHFHIPSLWGTKVHFPFLPIIDSSTGSTIANYLKSKIGGWF